jgi:hypothetical protein
MPFQTATGEFAMHTRAAHSEIVRQLLHQTRRYSNHLLCAPLYALSKRVFMHGNTSGPHEPFSEASRRALGIASSSAWFALSVIGFFMQREMVPAAKLVLSFVSPAIPGLDEAT